MSTDQPDVIPAQSHLNYARDVRAGLTVGQPMGPTTFGSWVYVVGAGPTTLRPGGPG